MKGREGGSEGSEGGRKEERESKYKGRDQRESKYKFTVNQLQAIIPMTVTVYVQLAISRPSIKIKHDREREIT